jgi:RNA polymerase sigma factor (sigma-70 family)
MHDREVVAAIVAGDPAGLAEAYDRYATPLYSFCRTMLREPADAADAVQDTFVIAAPRMSGLRDPERLRSWLYAVARNECHRRLRVGSQHASIEEAPDVTDEAADVAADVEREDLRALVHDALGWVGPADREVLELQLRQGLSGGEVASVLGISRNHAHALLSRARDQLQTSLGALVVARTGRQDCPELDAMLQDWDGVLTVLVRKRVNRHMERCRVCSGRRHREVSPATLLGIAPIAALPLMAGGLPAGFRDQVLRLATGHSPAAVAHRVGVAKTSYSFGHNGFPRPLHQPGSPWLHTPVHAGAVAGTAAAVVAGVTWIAVPPHHGVPPAGAATPSVSGSAGPALGNDGQPGPHRASATAQERAGDAGVSAGAGRPTPGVTAGRDGRAVVRGREHRDPESEPEPERGQQHQRHAGGRDAERQPGHAQRRAAGQRIDHPDRVRRRRELVDIRAARPREADRGGADVRHAGGGPEHHGQRHRAGRGQAAGAPHVQPERRDRDGGDQLSWPRGYGLRPTPP